MANPTYRQDDPDRSGGGLRLKRSNPTLPMKAKSYKWPALPGRPRKVHKPLGRHVKTAVEEDY